MAVRIAHAVNDENGASHGGKAGDQTGREVRIQNWYNRSKGWTALFRADSLKVAEKIASAAEAIAANENIGYDQWQRTTMWELARAAKWRFDKITTPCETDCSNMVSACVNAAGIKLSKDVYTGNLKQYLMETGKFTVHSLPRYLNKAFWLHRGDILLGEGHVCIVLTDGCPIFKEVAVGSIGADVRVLQEALNDLGYPCGKVDGEFGSRTRAALETYQTVHNLKVTCTANKKTVKEMGLVWKG